MATFRVCCDSSERRSVPGTSGCAVAASARVLRGKGLRISSDRDLCHAHGSWSGSGVGSRESHRRKSRMVEISLSGSGEGPGRVTSRPTLQAHLAPPHRSSVWHGGAWYDTGELVVGAAGVPWEDGGGITHGISPRRGVRDTDAAHTSPPRLH